MIYKLKQGDIDFFLSYQFIYHKDTINKSINFINNLKIDNNDFEIDYFLEKLYTIFSEEIFYSINEKKVSNIGVLLSGGIDSFILLYYLRKQYPNLEINTFTFFPRKPTKLEISELKKISQIFNTNHKNIYKEVNFIDIIKGLRELYGSIKEPIKEPIGDEGFIYNYIFLKEIKKYYNGKYLISGDGIDVLFGGLSMYRLSYLEKLYYNGDNIDDSFFINKYENQYFHKNIRNYDLAFFYKYGEYFGGNFIGKKSDDIKKYFYDIYNKLSNNYSRLKKQIYFNYSFLISSRKKFIYSSGDINGFELITPFINKSFVKKVVNLNIPDKYLLSKKNTKIIIKTLAKKIKKENNIDFNFLPTFKIDYFNEFNNNNKYIIAIGKRLCDKGYITKEYFNLIPYFIKNSMWYENKLRIYLLINLYFYSI